MNKPIEFPNNFNGFLNIGKHAFEQEHYVEALANFEAAYELDSNFELNTYLVRALMEMGQPERALTVAREFVPMYLADGRWTALYVNVLLATKHYLKAEKVVANLAETGSPLNKDIMDLFNAAKRVYQSTESRNIRQKSEQLLALGDLPPFEQMQRIPVIEGLTRDELVPAAQQLLVDQRVTLMIRTSLLENLAQLKITEPLHFLTVKDETITVVPADCGTIYGSEKVQRVLNGVAEDMEKNQPSMAKMVLKTARLHLGCLYPQADRWLTWPDLWVYSYSGLFQPETVPLSAEEQQLLKEIQLLQQKIDSQLPQHP